MQRKLRKLAPMPAGVAVVQAPGMTIDDLRRQFRTIRELGFNCVCELHLLPGVDLLEVMRAALDEHLVPFVYGEGGCEAATDELLTQLGIEPIAPMSVVRRDVRFVEYQENVLRQRAARECSRHEHDATHATISISADGNLGPGSAGQFTQWLREHYGTVEALTSAWNMDRARIPRSESMWTSWDDVDRGVVAQVQSTREYRRRRDVLRYKSDIRLGEEQERAAQLARLDHHAPACAGADVRLCAPFASMAVDMEGVAEAMRYAGVFHANLRCESSIEAEGDESIPLIYAKASLAADWFKGGWSAAMCDGGAGLGAGCVDGASIQQMLLSCLAAGLRGFGAWNWNAQTAGHGAGGCALTDRQLRPTDRAVEAGRIAHASAKWRDELWSSCKEPLVGVYTDFDSDCLWAALAIDGRDELKHHPMMARFGAARALINGNVPWEYVTGKNLDMGLADRYRAIYLPGVIALSYDRLELLREYVQSGGRLVMDLPGGWFDDFGRTMHTGVGSLFEQIFGCVVRDFHASQPAWGRAWSIGEVHCGEGFVVDLEVTTGTTTDKYHDGRPAIVENRLGAGGAVFVGMEAGRHCHAPGNRAAETLLRGVVLGGMPLPFTCDGAIAFRRWSPVADHFFIANEGPARDVKLESRELKYAGFEDAVSGERVHPQKIAVPAQGARWLRAAR